MAMTVEVLLVPDIVTWYHEKSNIKTSHFKKIKKQNYISLNQEEKKSFSIKYVSRL